MSHAGKSQLQSAAAGRALLMPVQEKHQDPECWVIYMRPKHIPASTTEADWPGRFVARRFEKQADNRLHPTDDLKWSNRSCADLLGQLPPALECYAPTPEDDPSILQTRFTRPRKAPFDLDMRLSSGITTREAITRAEAWWDKDGRRAISKDFNSTRDPGKIVTRKGRAPALFIPPEMRQHLPSGILRGLCWSALSRGEKLKVVQVWHQVFMIAPQVESQIAAMGEVRCPVCKETPGRRRMEFGLFDSWDSIRKRYPDAIRVSERKFSTACTDCGGTGKILPGLRVQ